jgi:hypothetical protein
MVFVLGIPRSLGPATCLVRPAHLVGEGGRERDTVADQLRTYVIKPLAAMAGDPSWALR